MGSKFKEDERNERTIRALLKQSENRRCINCGSLGPQYVCTTFSIFVCTNCSGLHREFSHRIKSVSMAKFTAEEVKNLQNGGNERGRELFLKDYDFQRNPLPDSSNPERLREFIRHVYEQRRFSGDRPPPRGRQGDRDDSFESKFDPRQDARPNTTRSPSFEEKFDDRRSMERRRSDVDRARYDDRVVRFEEKRSPSRFEADRGRFSARSSQYDDHFRQEDRSYNSNERDWDRRGGSYDDRLPPNDVGHRHDRRRSADDKPYVNRDSGGDDSPPIRPVSEILGTNVPPLWVEEYRHTNGGEEVQIGSPAEQRKDLRIPRPGPVGPLNGAAVVLPTPVIKRVNSGSLIDFTAESEPSVPSISATDPFGVSSVVLSEPPTGVPTSSDAGWATFDTAPTAVAQLPPAEAPPAGYPKAGFPAPSNGDQWATGGWPSSHQPPPTQAASTAPVDDWFNQSAPVQPPPPPPQQQPAIPTGSQGLQHWKSFPTAGSDSVSSSEAARQQIPEEPKVSSRASMSRELPKELFTHSWDGVTMPPGRMPYMHGFPPAGHHQTLAPVTMPPYVQPPRSRNPFDFPNDGAASTGVGSFPSLGTLQAALPNGPSHVPAGVPTASTNQWSAMGLHPASFPPSGSDGAGSAYTSHLSMPSSMRHGPALGTHLGYSDFGSFNGRGMSAPDISLTGSFEFPSRSGSSEFASRSGSSEFPQNHARTSSSGSGNPFG